MAWSSLRAGNHTPKPSPWAIRLRAPALLVIAEAAG
jgi:hypothetical protein